MKRLQVLFILALLIAGFTASNEALAWRHGVRFGVYVGPGYWYPPPYYYYPPYYYPPYPYPPVVVAPATTTYIEQAGAQPAAAPALAPGFWYYCDASKAYYPYAKECPAGWQRVAPQPANP